MSTGKTPHAYWAKFARHRGDLFRLDTRVYLSPVARIHDSDNCLGAIVGKNPGSAKPLTHARGLQPISLDGDKCLPIAKSIVLKSYQQINCEPPPNSYIQVLNLFYLCEPKLPLAIRKLKAHKRARKCPSESQPFPWVWYVWGGPSPRLDGYKKRFGTLNTANHFYLDKHASRVIASPASASVFAKHTQGLRHELVLPHIASLLKSIATQAGG